MHFPSTIVIKNNIKDKTLNPHGCKYYDTIGEERKETVFHIC